MKSECGNCDWVGEPEIGLAEIPNLTQRIDVGGEVPSGECPECGVLCYVVDDDEEKTPLAKLLALIESMAEEHISALEGDFSEEFGGICYGREETDDQIAHWKAGLEQARKIASGK